MMSEVDFDEAVSLVKEGKDLRDKIGVDSAQWRLSYLDDRGRWIVYTAIGKDEVENLIKPMFADRIAAIQVRLEKLGVGRKIVQPVPIEVDPIPEEPVPVDPIRPLPDTKPVRLA